jgi:AAA+ ATPase superfamily predicted ATPase
MTPLIGRDDERRRLVEAADRPPQLVVIRGRRRVGKSFLIHHSLEGRRQVSLQADEQEETGHLGLLADEIARLLPGSPPLRFSSWDEALRLLTAEAEREPLVLVLDEFQWLLQAQPALDSILQRHWDRWQRSATPITLVLSGSALSLMEGLLDHGRPLFGRADYRPLLEPLDYRTAAELASPRLSPAERLRRYAVLGGTPQYQVWAGGGRTLPLIGARVLRRGESLYEEPLHLLREEQRIRDPGTYFAVLRAIAAGATRFNEIKQRAHIGANLDVMLARLEELGYVERRTPVGQGGGRPSYRIRDPFFRFWFRYVFPARSRLERGRVDEVLAEIEDDLDTFLGPAFEDCCREWVARYAPAEMIPRFDALGAWWSRTGDVEIDIVATRKERPLLLGSCKWSTRAPVTALEELRRAQARLGPAAAGARLALFARGFTHQLRRRAGEEGVRLIGAADLFD